MNNTNNQGSGIGQQQGSQSVQGSGQFNQQQFDKIVREGRWNSQSDANNYLQQHGLSCQMSNDGTAKIYQGQDQSKQIGTVSFKGQDQSKQIDRIDFQSGQ